MSAFSSLSTAAIKGFYRDRATLFFTFAFPLIFIVIFGSIFSGAGAEKIEIGVVGGGPVIEGLRASGALEFVEFDNFQEAFAQVEDGDLPAVVAQEGDRVTLRFAASDQTAAATIRGILDGVVNELNLQAAAAEPAFQLSASQVEDSSLEPIQFIVPGMMSWGVAFAALFGSAITLVNWRRKQVLRRLRSAPVGTFSILGSRLVATLFIGVSQAVVFLGVGMILFDLRLTGNWWYAIPIFLLGVISFFTVGLVVGAICRTEEAASGVGNAIVIPMSFMSGVFFPLDQAPGWMRTVSNVMPLKYMNEGITNFLVRDQGPAELVTPSLVLLGFSLVMVLLAARLFRWEAD